jgi:hypothetical protein
MGSHQVFNVFPKGLPIAPHFIPICFAQSPPLLTHIVGPIEEGGAPSYHSIFCVGGASIVSTFVYHGQIKLAHCKKKKKKKKEEKQFDL